MTGLVSLPGSLLLSAGEDKSLRLWDLTTMKQLQVQQGGRGGGGEGGTEGGIWAAVSDGNCGPPSQQLCSGTISWFCAVRSFPCRTILMVTAAARTSPASCPRLHPPLKPPTPCHLLKPPSFLTGGAACP